MQKTLWVAPPPQASLLSYAFVLLAITDTQIYLDLFCSNQIAAEYRYAAGECSCLRPSW